MVFYNAQARFDLQEIFDNLLMWTTPNLQIHLNYHEVVGYYNDIVDVCDSLDNISYHAKAKYRDHLKYGTYVYSYNRNKRTTWYIVYEKTDNNIFINKIINNYQTITPQEA